MLPYSNVDKEECEDCAALSTFQLVKKYGMRQVGGTQDIDFIWIYIDLVIDVLIYINYIDLLIYCYIVI